MKKVLYNISILFVAIGVLSSCEAELDQTPFDEFASPSAFVSVDDFENGVRGIYLGLTDPSYYGGSDAGSLLSSPDIASDNLITSQLGRTTQRTLHNWRYTPSSGNSLAGLYGAAYQVVYRANQLLFFSESFEGDNKDRVVAEAKALRALAHFDVVKTFGKIPTQSGDANGSLGIAYVTEFDNTIEPPRETVGAVYTKIVQDLTEALPNIPESASVGRFDKNAVNLILSRVYLYMGQWQNAFNAADKVTTPVAPRESVVGVWQDLNNDGLVFFIPNTSEGINDNIGVAYSQFSLNSIVAEYVVSFPFYNLFEEDDIRREAYIADGRNTSGGVTTNVNAVIKYLGKDGSSTGLVNYKLFRAAEARLNKAEALYNLGSEGPARDELNALRAQRYETPPAGTESGTALRDAIRLERRFEFAFEYQRFYDLKRWGLAITRGNFGDESDGTGVRSEELTLPAGSFKFQFPLSQNILDRNPNNVQNPGY